MNADGESLFKALADRQRRRILKMLRRGEMAAGEISNSLGLTPATVSHHLAKLRSAGLIRTRREGQLRIYALNTSVVEDAMLMVAELLESDQKA